METKKWWQSKIIWASIVAVIVSAYNTASTQFGLPAIPEFIYAILAAFVGYNRTTTTTVIK